MDASSTESEKSSSSSSDNFDVWSDEGNISDNQTNNEDSSGSSLSLNIANGLYCIFLVVIAITNLSYCLKWRIVIFIFIIGFVLNSS